MQNLLANSRSVTLENNGRELTLTLKPITFAKMSDMTMCLEGRDLPTVLRDPSPLDLTLLCYCLLDKESKEALNNIEIEIGDEIQDSNESCKLYYFISETTVEEGHRNVYLLSEVLKEQVKDSLPIEDKKKLSPKLVRKLLLIRKRFLTLLTVVIILIGMTNLLLLLPLNKLIDLLN